MGDRRAEKKTAMAAGVLLLIFGTIAGVAFRCLVPKF
jgi:hypothetical protein